MKIQILVAPPVDSRHKITVGRVFEVLSPKMKDPQGWWIMGDMKKRVLVLHEEAQEVR